MIKKGFSLPTETVVYVLIALIVLFLVIYIFQDQAKMFFETIRKFFGFVDTSIPK